MTQILIAVLLTPLLLVGWVIVQAAWRRSFELTPDDDALAARGGCSSCSGRCSNACKPDRDLDQQKTDR